MGVKCTWNGDGGRATGAFVMFVMESLSTNKCTSNWGRFVPGGATGEELLMAVARLALRQHLTGDIKGGEQAWWCHRGRSHG